MKEFDTRTEFASKCNSGEASMATTAVLQEWEPTKAICPECGGKHVVINTRCVLTSLPPQYQYKCNDCGNKWTGYKVQSISSMQSWPDLEYEDVTPLGHMGWICPKCGRVYSPTTNQCLFCGGTYSPNIVYCGPSNGTKDILDTMTISNTTNSSKINATQGTQSNSLKYESFKQQHGE